MTFAAVALFGLLLALLLTSTSIGVALGLSSLLYLLLFTTVPLTQIPDTLFNALNNFPMVAIPMFVLAATIMSRGGISDRLTKACLAVIGGFRGGLAMTAVVSCIFFAAISGSSPATVVAVGTLMIPAMINSGYGRDFSTGLIATSGSLGILIPPSIPLIIYGISSGESIGDLFIAGIIPGFVAGGMLLLLAFVISWKRGYGASGEGKIARSEKLMALRDGVLSMLLPVIVLGGIYGGIFTPTEAAASAVAYALLVSGLVYRELSFKDIGSVLLQSSRMSAMIMFIIANGVLFSFVLSQERIPSTLTSALLTMNLSKVSFLALVTILLLIVGCFMETTSALLILTPILLPIALELGVDPIHFGIIMVMNLEIGLITPPLGLNLFVASGLAKMSVIRVAKAVLPSAVVLFVALIIVTAVPWFSTVLL